MMALTMASVMTPVGEMTVVGLVVAEACPQLEKLASSEEMPLALLPLVQYQQLTLRHRPFHQRPPVAALQGGVEVEVEVLITQARRLFAQQASRSAVPIWGVPPTWLLPVDLCSRRSQAG